MSERVTVVEGVVSAPPFSRISWGSIIAGTVCAFALQLLLNLVGLGVGLSAVDFGDGEGGLTEIGIAAGVWWGLASIVSLIVGGWIAGRLAGVPIRITAALHGLAVWALATLLIVWLSTTTLATAVSGAFGAVGQIGQATATAVGGLATSGESAGSDASQQRSVLQADRQLQSVMSSIRQDAQQIYNQVVSEQEQQSAVDAATSTARDIIRSPADAGQDLNRLIDTLFASDGVLSEANQQEVATLLEERLGVSSEEAQQIIDNWQERYQAAAARVDEAVETLRQQAVETADEATEAVGAAAGWTALALTLGLIAAVVGGVLGKPEAWQIEASERERHVG